MTAIIGYLHNDYVFVSADSSRTGNGVKITVSDKIKSIGNGFYIATAGAEMDAIKNSVISTIQAKKLLTLNDIIVETTTQFLSEYNKLVQKNLLTNSVTVVLFGVDENKTPFLLQLDSEDNFLPQSIPPNKVLAIGTYDVIIENKAENELKLLKKKINNVEMFQADEWAYNTMGVLIKEKIFKDSHGKLTIDYPAYCYMIRSDGEYFNILKPIITSYKTEFEAPV